MTSLKGLHRGLRPYAEHFLLWAESNGYRPRVTSTRRSRVEQIRLYRRYLQGRQPYPVAYPGTSAHEVGLALDLVSRDNAALGRAWAELGGRWAGPGDPVHFGV